MICLSYLQNIWFNLSDFAKLYKMFTSYPEEDVSCLLLLVIYIKSLRACRVSVEFSRAPSLAHFSSFTFIFIKGQRWNIICIKHLNMQHLKHILHWSNWTKGLVRSFTAVHWKAQCDIYSVLADSKPPGCVLAETIVKGHDCGLWFLLLGRPHRSAVMEQKHNQTLFFLFRSFCGTLIVL